MNLEQGYHSFKKKVLIKMVRIPTMEVSKPLLECSSYSYGKKPPLPSAKKGSVNDLSGVSPALRRRLCINLYFFMCVSPII